MQWLRNRTNIIILLVCTALLGIVVRLTKLQIVQGDDYRQQSENRLVSNMPLPAPRGEILDRYGRPLVTNRMGFSIQFQKSGLEDAELNAVILDLVGVMEEKGEEYLDSMPLSADGSAFLFSEYEGEERDKKIADFLEDHDMEGLDAPAALEAFCTEYGIDAGYTTEQKRKIAGVRYEMQTRAFSANNPYTFATDVSLETVTLIREQNRRFKSVSIITAPTREYVYDNLASHILGRVGVIYAEEYEELKDEGYGMNDIIGKDGMEKYLEPYIRGKDGRSSVEQTLEGRTTVISEEVPAVPGNNALLTIDLDLQRVAEESLENTIASIRQAGERRADKRGAAAKSGSVVAVDVNTGEVLAMASYPDFNPKTFNEDYAAMYNDPVKPMFNRAISGSYPPGSTFKMLTSIAGLEEGVITPDEVIVDKGVYQYYGQSFNCWIYTDTRGTHGPETVSDALRDSCNYYFYETGRRLGVDKLVEYGKQFGMGEYTGLEIEGETKGVLASPDYKQRVFDEQWYPGDTLQMAIGQSFTLMSPVQIASYVATVANGGTRYKTHLLKTVRSYDTGEEMVAPTGEVYNTVEMQDSTYHAVTQGMREAAQDAGTAGTVFGDFPIEVCAKTGSAQVSTGVANGVFVAYAPYEDPQIAVAVVVENAGSGNSIAPVARDIFTEYFGLNVEHPADTASQKNTLLP